MVSYSFFCFLHFFSLIALNGTFRRVQNAQKGFIQLKYPTIQLEPLILSHEYICWIGITWHFQSFVFGVILAAVMFPFKYGCQKCAAVGERPSQKEAATEDNFPICLRWKPLPFSSFSNLSISVYNLFSWCSLLGSVGASPVQLCGYFMIAIFAQTYFASITTMETSLVA